MMDFDLRRVWLACGGGGRFWGVVPRPPRAYPCVRFAPRPLSPSERGRWWTRLILPLGEDSVQWICFSNHRRVGWVACDSWFEFHLVSSTADVARPSALREAADLSAPVIARLFLSLVL